MARAGGAAIDVIEHVPAADEARFVASTLEGLEGAQVKLRNTLTGVEQNDVQALLLWTMVWGYHRAAH